LLVNFVVIITKWKLNLLKVKCIIFAYVFWILTPGKMLLGISFVNHASVIRL